MNDEKFKFQIIEYNRNFRNITNDNVKLKMMY